MVVKYISFAAVAFLTCTFAEFSLASGASSNSGGWENSYANDSSSIVPLFTFGEKSYYLGKHFKATYLQAYQFCNDMHMDLISIKSKEENDFVFQYLTKNIPDDLFWTAGSRLLDGKNWIWMTNGEPVDYTNWRPGQPSGTTEMCLNMYQIKNQGLLWNDLDCNWQTYFLCERDKKKNYKEKQDTKVTLWSNLFQNPTLSPSVPLLHYLGKSYYFGTTFKATFLQATQFCQMIQMQLVTITSKEENSRLYKYIRDTHAGDSFWTSGNKQIDLTTWIWFSTGQTIEYTNWIAGQPDNPKTELCIQAQNKDDGLMWNNVGCDNQLYFICENSSSGNNNPVLPNGQCCCVSDPDKTNSSLPVTTVDGKHYLISSTKVNYYQASELCDIYGMQLLSITNKTKTDALRKLLEHSPNDIYWTSGNRLSDTKTWTWSNGDALKYTNWAAGEPNNARHNEYCLDIFTNAEWNDQPCDDAAYFVCEDIDKHHCSC